MPGRAGQPAQTRSPPQFSLRSLCWLVVGCHFYFSMLISMPMTVGDGIPPPSAILAVICGGVFFAVVYLRRHLVITFLIHCYGLGMVAVLTVIAFPSPTLSAEFSLRILLLGCFLGTLLSGPLFIAGVLRSWYCRTAHTRRVPADRYADFGPHVHCDMPPSSPR